MKSKVISVAEALDMIRDGDTVGISGAGMRGYPEYLSKNLEKKFLETGSPRNLTLFAVVGHGAFDERGDSHLGHEGLLKKAICTHPDTNPPLADLLSNNKIEGYIFPQGVTAQLLRSIAAKQPGYITKIGLGTYIDPRVEGAKANDITKEDIIDVINLNGEEWLMYKTFPINVALIRGTTSDENGNISIEHECNRLEFLELATAVKSCGGKVIVQVKRVVENGNINSRNVCIPAPLVDAVVVPENPDVDHMQTDATVYSQLFSGEIRIPQQREEAKATPLGPRDIIARRAAMELFPGAVVNLGWGIPGTISAVAEAENLIDKITLTVELGVFGGAPSKFPNFGAVANAEAVIPMANMFDFYDAGGLHEAFLGAAQMDKLGNVNVSKFGTRVCGPGGFVDITTSTPKIVFCTPFTTKGFKGEVKDGKLNIINEGSVKKFVEKVDQISFNGQIAAKTNKEVMVVTERAVLRLIDGEVTVTEIAPGVDLEKDVLSQMEFRPKVSSDLKLMDARIFTPGAMNYFGLL